jgi:hypothetical protein
VEGSFCQNYPGSGDLGQTAIPSAPRQGPITRSASRRTRGKNSTNDSNLPGGTGINLRQADLGVPELGDLPPAEGTLNNANRRTRGPPETTGSPGNTSTLMKY